MNDPEIRQLFHNNFLSKNYEESDTLIIDELGLEHGKCRADIAVINGYLNGFEIKSNEDTLSRLTQQIKSYDAVFDHSFLITEGKHVDAISTMVPKWWGIILVTNSDNCFQFKILRNSSRNTSVNDYAVAQLLWRNEAQCILYNLGVRGKRLREKRSILYSCLVEEMESDELRRLVRWFLKNRRNWRHHE
jgi:hypothetical protein